MANRHLARSVALQSLYAWDFRGLLNGVLREVVAHTVRECAPELEDASFVGELITGVVAKRAELDRVIEKAAPEWPLGQITFVDRNILRLGLWELLFGNKEEVPPKVAINEAIELAKTFGSQSSGRFVNGVLGTVYRELDVDESRSVDQESRDEELAGAIVFRRGNGSVYLAMVKDVFDYWTFVKGHIQPGESSEAAALRETKEEVGLTGVVGEPLGKVSYVAKGDGGEIKRNVAYYLVETDEKELKLEASAGLKEARWVKPDGFKKLKHYENQEEIVKKASEYINSKVSG